MKVSYNNKEITDGKFISPQNSQIKPIIDYQATPNTLYTLILYDPDAPSGNHLHWVVVNIQGNNINSGNTLLEYMGPAPPKGSGTHKYIFLLIEQREKKYLETLQRIMSMETLFNKLHLKEPDSKEVSRSYFTSSNQIAGKKRKRSKTKSRSKKTRSLRLKKRN